MNFWKRLFGSEETEDNAAEQTVENSAQAPAQAEAPAPTRFAGVTTPSNELADAGERLISACLTTLERVDIEPKPAVELADIEDAVLDDLDMFRRRPLTTMMALRDPSEELIFSHVYVDDNDKVRATPEDLVEYLDEVATAAGSDVYIIDLVVFPDPDTPNHGSLRFRKGEWDVHDISYELDPDFGDVEAEAKFASAVSCPGRTAYTFEAAYHTHPVTVWVNEQEAYATNFRAAVEAELEAH
ncbi:hypothetical protein QP027_07855 [Corynebacterium breve]|uniref:Uncharacterized protein n=1 Tax=Corynebacterium breve TaxID=3049799 RepID=A0ABY8VHL3_9CORY|nr:hypothetical protein [Corynebacterium breve]WIM67040.1 hypothetical protein QP027_07855 [Corynebacterium breve]